jgi:hypothetical protein
MKLLVYIHPSHASPLLASHFLKRHKIGKLVGNPTIHAYFPGFFFYPEISLQTHPGPGGAFLPA